MLAENVFVDAASLHDWDSLLQGEFVAELMTSLQAAMADFAAFNFFLFSPASARVLPASAALALPRKVLIFLSDESGSDPVHLESRYAAIFKTHLHRERAGSNIRPLPLGTVRGIPVLPSRQVGERPTDLFFSGNLNAARLRLYQQFHPVLRRLPRVDGRLLLRAVMRSGLPKALRMDFSEGRDSVSFTGGFGKGLAPDAYAAALADSKIALCPAGFTNAETFRHSEALRAGAVVVSDHLPDLPFYRGAPFVTVDNWRDGLREARKLLRDGDRLAELQRRGLDWYEAHLSPRGAARAMAAALGQLA